MTFRRLLTAVVVMLTAVVGFLVWTPPPAVAATTGCQSSATAPTPGPGQVVLWMPAPSGTVFYPNTVVMNIGDPVLHGCFLDSTMPSVVSVAPGAALMVWGDDENTGQPDLFIPWGGLSLSQTTPININPNTPENWVGTTAGVSVISAVEMLQAYGTCQFCDLTGKTLKLPGDVAPATMVGELEGNVGSAKLASTTLTGDGSGYVFTGADLTGATVSANLAGATMTSAIVDHAVFGGSSFQQATMNNLVYTRPPDLSHTTIGGGGFGTCTNLGGNNLLEVPYTGLVWDNSGCTGQVFPGSTVPFGMLGPIFVAGQAKAVDLSNAKIISTTSDRGAFAGGNLQTANLAGLNVLGAPLDLTGTKLDGATLTNAQFPLAELTGATLTNISAAGLNLNGAHLGTGASTPAAVLSGANTNLQSADFVGADVSGVGFVGADVSNADFTRALGNNVDFTGVRAAATTFRGAHLYGNGGAFDSATDLSGADFTNAVLASSVTETGGFSLTKAPLTGAHFDGAVCVACNFAGATLTDATFGSAYLPGVNLTNATLTGAHFVGAWLYCGSPSETACENTQSSTYAWPLALGTGESYGPVPYTPTGVNGGTLVGVATCPGGATGSGGCDNQLLPSASSAPPIPAPCSSAARGSCPSGTTTWRSSSGPPGTSPISLAATAPLTWHTTLADQGYYTGYDNHTVQRVGNGSATAVAGQGVACAQPQQPCGDGGPATSARLGTPAGLAVGLDGTLYIADSALRRIRAVSPAGVITTVAGTGSPCASTCGDGSAATAAALTAANGVAVDPHGTLYIADGTAGLRKVGPLGTLSTVAAGSATGTLASVAIGLDGTLYGATRNPDGIIGVNPGTGAVSPLVGTGTSGYNGDLDDLDEPQAGTSTQVSQPTGVSVTLDNYLAFADTGNNLIRRYNIATTYMAEDLAGVVNANGVPQSGTTPDGQPANATLLKAPLAVAATATADYLITDSGNDSVRRIGPYLNGDGSVGLPPKARQVLDCQAGKAWSCRLLPASAASPRTSATSAVTVSRNGVEYASGPELRDAGGGNRFLVTLQRPLDAGRYTLTRRVGKSNRDVAMTLTIG